MEYRTLGGSGAVVSSYAIGTMTFGVETPEERGARAARRLRRRRRDVRRHRRRLRRRRLGGDRRAAGSSTRPAEVRDRVVLATKGRFPTGAGPERRRALPAPSAARARGLAAPARRGPRRPVPGARLGPAGRRRRSGSASSTTPSMPGTIGYPGLSNLTGWQVQKVVDIADFGGLARPVTLQPQYNLLVREIEWEIVPACLAEGLGLLPWSPLGGGWLTGKYSREQAPSGATRLGENPDRGVEAYGRRSAQERTWDVVAAVQKVAEGTRRLDGAGGAGVAARPAGGDVGDPRRAHRRPAARQPRAPPACTSATRRLRRWTPPAIPAPPTTPTAVPAPSSAPASWRAAAAGAATGAGEVVEDDDGRVVAPALGVARRAVDSALTARRPRPGDAIW